MLQPRLRTSLVVASLLVCSNHAIRTSAEDLGIRAPRDFVVELYAGDALAHDIFCMTLDSQGRVVVAGKNYVKTLHDDDGDGRADRATLFSIRPASGAHGMCFDGPDLICTGDNALMKLRDTNGDGEADGEPEIWAKLEHREHGANGVVKGPDGWFYLICGNDAGANETLATLATSPIKQPHCGVLLRFSPDGKRSEILAHGFRNPYDLDFNDQGHFFTVDADGERDHYLPWYTGTRLFHIGRGLHHGWVNHGWQNSWNRPGHFADNAPRLVEIGRGSPTGVVVYRRQQFPSRYRGNVFSSCWSLGRVYHFPLVASGSSYSATKEIFLETTGSVGFAPVDLAVNAQGDMFIAVGGRGTRGSVFRVRYVGPAEPKTKSPAVPTSDSPSVAALFDRRDRRQREISLAAVAHDSLKVEFNEQDVEHRLARGRVRATRGELTAKDFESFATIVSTEEDRPERRLEALRLAVISLGDLRSENATPPVYAGYEAIDLAKLAPDVRKRWAQTLAGAFPTNDDTVNHELARVLGIVTPEDRSLLERLSQLWTESSSVESDIHYLIVLSRLPGERTAAVTHGTARALSRLHGKMIAGEKFPSRNWPLRLAETFEQLVARDPRLAAALVDEPAFGLAEHGLFAARMPGETKSKAARKLLAASRKDDDFRFTGELLNVIAALPADESLPVLRQQWAEVTLRDTIVAILAREPAAEDRARFVEMLAAIQPRTVETAAKALVQLGGDGQPEELAAALRALRLSCGLKEFAAVRRQLVMLLTKWSRQAITIQESSPAGPLDDYRPWFAWFEKAHPKLLPQSQGATAIDTDAWRQRFEKIDWTAGDVERGKKAFEKRSCARCHSVSDRIGPDLAGAAGRFSRDDLFTAILDPNKEVAPLYQTTQLITKSGKVFQGLVVYESPESTLMQISPDVTLRVTGDEIISQRKSRQSIMPMGLLNNSDDQELADLYALLKTLRGAK